jgi:hypothetical protein
MEIFGETKNMFFFNSVAFKVQYEENEFHSIKFIQKTSQMDFEVKNEWRKENSCTFSSKSIVE